MKAIVMKDDIVTRLREEQAEEKQLGNDLLAEVLWDAADEIERLQEQLSKLCSLGDQLADFVLTRLPCTCRRGWVCHKCQTVNSWKETKQNA